VRAVKNISYGAKRYALAGSMRVTFQSHSRRLCQINRRISTGPSYNKEEVRNGIQSLRVEQGVEGCLRSGVSMMRSLARSISKPEFSFHSCSQRHSQLVGRFTQLEAQTTTVLVGRVAYGVLSPPIHFSCRRHPLLLGTGRTAPLAHG
jgi:hypothetical protein